MYTYITYICSVTLQTLTETIPSIWFNTNIDYLLACQVLTAYSRPLLSLTITPNLVP